MKHSIIHPILCAALALGAATTGLHAQTPSPGPTGTPGVGAPPPPPPGHHGPPPSPLFRALDTNGDGVISADEIANAPTTLKTLAGASGQITRDSLRPPRREGDEQKQGDEARRPHHRPPPDAQGDENPAPRPLRQPEDRPQRPPPDGEHGPRKQDNTPAPGAPPADAPPDGPAGRHHGPPHGDGLFNALDADGDGTVSAEEIAAAATALKKADTNGDGVIDRRDFRPPPPPPAPAD